MPTSNPSDAVDPRGQRFAAAVTAVVLAAVLLTASTAVLAWQAAVFALAVVFGVRRSPYALVYARLVRPRLGPPAEVEDPGPPRFAQLVGLGFSALALAALITGLETLGLVAVGAALGAAFLNAVFGLCLGCEAYLLITRILPVRGRGGITTTEVSA